MEFSGAAEGLGYNDEALKDLFNSALDEPLSWWRMSGLDHLTFGEFVEALARSPAKVAGVPQVVGDKAAAPPVAADGAGSAPNGGRQSCSAPRNAEAGAKLEGSPMRSVRAADFSPTKPHPVVLEAMVERARSAPEPAPIWEPTYSAPEPAPIRSPRSPLQSPLRSESPRIPLRSGSPRIPLPVREPTHSAPVREPTHSAPLREPTPFRSVRSPLLPLLSGPTYSAPAARSYPEPTESRSDPGAHAFRSGPGAHAFRSGPGAHAFRSDPGAHTFRSNPGAHGVRSRARSDPRAHGFRSRARSDPGAHGVRSGPGAQAFRSGPGAHAFRSGPGAHAFRSGPGAHRARSRASPTLAPLCAHCSRPSSTPRAWPTSLLDIFLFNLCGASGIRSLKGGLCHGPAGVPRLATRCLCVLSTWLVCLVPCAPMSIVCPLPSCYLIIVSVAPAVSPSLPSFVSLYSSPCVCSPVLIRCLFVCLM